MDTGHAGSLDHQQALEALPWYVNGRLNAEEARRIETHLSGCSVCRSEANGLTKLLTTHQQSIPERPVNEARLGALLDRIERYEANRQPSGSAQSAWERFRERMNNWLNIRPMLLAGVCATALVALLVTPVMLRSPATTTAPNYEVAGPAVDELRVKLLFQEAPDRKEVERLVGSTVSGAYRIEQLGSAEYLVILENKPGFEAFSRLFNKWRSAPNVAEVQIDAGTAAVEKVEN